MTLSTDSTHSSKLGLNLTFMQTLWAVTGLCLVIMLVALDQTVVGTALPIIATEFKRFDLYAWVATSYLLTSVITVPIFGRLGDHFGRRSFVIFSIVLFTLASILCGMAQSMAWLIFARALQGVAGGALVGTAFACIPDLFHDMRQRLKWQIAISISYGAAGALGPTLGGFLTEYYGWRSVFYINLPVGILGLALVAAFLPHIRHTDKTKSLNMDVLGAILIAIALGGSQLFVEYLPHFSLHSLMLSIVFIVSLCAFVGLVLWERRCKDPIIPIDMFTDRAQGTLLFLSLLVGGVMLVLLIYLPLFFQGGYGLTPQETGVLISPLVVCITIGNLINMRLVTRMQRPNHMLTIGFILLAVACFGIACSPIIFSKYLMMAWMFIGGIGLGFLLPNLTLFMQELAKRSQLGIATALVQSLRMIGGIFAIAIIGTMIHHRYVSGIQQKLDFEHLPKLSDMLSDPQLLINKKEQAAFLIQAQHQHVDGPGLIEFARSQLIASFHEGALLTAMIVLLAMWCMRYLPLIQFRHQKKESFLPMGE